MKIWGPVNGITGIYNKNKSVEKLDKNSEVVPKKDILSISEQAKDFQVINKALKSVPDIRQEKIKPLQDRYQSGTYNVTGKEIAEKLTKSIIDRKA